MSLPFTGVQRQETPESLKHAVFLSGFMDLHRLSPQKKAINAANDACIFAAVCCACVKTDGETADQFLRRWILSKRLHMDWGRWWDGVAKQQFACQTWGSVMLWSRCSLVGYYLCCPLLKIKSKSNMLLGISDFIGLKHLLLCILS